MQRALDGVYGVDINPFAAAIATFRLLVAALRASRIARLKEAPNFWTHVAAGDSLLHGRRFNELDVGSDVDRLKEQEEFTHAFQAEDLDELTRILGQQYHVVVGNPPYVTVKDRAVSQLYRARYTTCHRQYSLAVPFAERIFGLALQADGSQQAGYVGMITANSFMKREFGKKLTELYLPTVDLTHVIDTSGAYIPGHGTPTVIMLARHRAPVVDVIRTVMGIRGEPETPRDPSSGKVWSAIVDCIDFAPNQNVWVSSEDTERRVFVTHPWSIGGGGATELKKYIDARATRVLSDEIGEIGFGAVTREDDAYLVSAEVANRLGVEPQFIRQMVIGDAVRDWSVNDTVGAIWPYDEVSLQTIGSDALIKFLWRFRTRLRERVAYGKSQIERGLTWYEYSMFFKNRYSIPLSITFAFVATHNHFVLDRGGRIFNRSAPVIKLSRGANEASHLSLVGLLNSSLACFWMKQTFHNKGSTVDAQGARQTTDAFENFYEHTVTGLKRFPLPNGVSIDLAALLDQLGEERRAHLPAMLASRFPMTSAELDGHRDTAAGLLARMIPLQEELDWECYLLYEIADPDCRYSDPAGNFFEPPPVVLGERAFEIILARRMATGEVETTWFLRHGSTPVTELPDHWPSNYRSVVERRIELIESNRFIGLIERPEYKRRWNVEAWDVQERRALRNWLLNRLESSDYWHERRLATVKTLAERAAVDRKFLQVAERYAGHAGVDIETLVTDLVEAESVPALPVQRYKPSGLTKREDWERTWKRQRREDEIDAEVAAATPRREDENVEEHATRLQAEQRRRKQEEIDDLTPSPKYRSADFLKPTYWRLRGALDVPKERFVSLPQMSRDSDPTLLVGWAGWTELDLCQAVATYSTEVVEQDGWTATRLTPLLAIIQENLPWLKQWHNEVDSDYNLRLGDFFETFLSSQLSNHGLTVDDLRHWTLPGPQQTE